MAKKAPKKESGPGPFMIITLVFFIIATLALGFMYYSSIDEVAQAQANEKSAKDALAQRQNENSTTYHQMLVHKAAMGTLEAKEREDLSSASASAQTVIEDTKRTISEKVPTIKWGNDHTPEKTLPTIAKEANDRSNNLTREVADAKTKQQTAEAAEVAARNRADAAKTAFDAQVDAMKAKNAADLDANRKAFDQLKVTADLKAKEYKKDTDNLAEEKKSVEDQLAAAKKKIIDLTDELVRAQDPNRTDLEARYKKLDLVKVADRMGVIVDKTDKFVTLRFETKLNLLAGQAFVVITPNTSLASVIDREVILERQHHEFKSLDAREPFADNEMIKGTVEITEVTGDYTARARITSQVQSIRNPISKNDQLFNVALSTISKEHVGFAGIIDLDGDGNENNDAFIKILEKNNITVDAYLDVKKGQIIKRGDGMSLRTKFLVVGTDAPPVGKIKDMMDEAKAKGIQMIDARKFLWLIGVRPPQNAQRPYYPGVDIIGEKEPAKDPAKDK